MLEGGLLKTAVALTVGDHSLHVGMADDVLVLDVALEYIVLHVVSSFVPLVFKRLSYKRVNHCFLLVGQGVEYILNSLAAVVSVIRMLYVTFALTPFLESLSDECVNDVFLLFVKSVEHILNRFAAVAAVFRMRELLIIVLTVIRMAKLDRLAGEYSAFSVITFVAVRHDCIDKSSRIRSGKDEAHLADVAVHDVAVPLLELIGINGKLLHIAVSHDPPRVHSALCVVERAVGVNAVVTVLKQRVP